MRFFVGVDAICRCDFFGKKGCDAIAIPGYQTTIEQNKKYNLLGLSTAQKVTRSFYV